jgi:aminoglycoside phosphotransferase (APT) family kinase protein
MHALWLARPFDGADSVVLRRYVIATVVDEQPDIAAREACVLQFVERAAVPTPRMLALDPTGTESGAPAMVMSRLAGRLDWSPADADRWLRGLAGVLPAFHALPLDNGPGLSEFRPYDPESWAAPMWMQRPALWERAVEVFHGPPIDHERVFIHRDFHPGNVLWRRGRVTGVVDWQAGCIGPPSVDAFWCRVNIMGSFGLDLADRFITVWQKISGRTYHPWAEVVMLLDVMAWPVERTRREGADLEHALAQRLSELSA